MAALGKHLTGGAEQARLKQLANLRSAYGDLFQETVETIEISGTPAARDHFAAKTEPALAALLKVAWLCQAPRALLKALGHDA